MRLHQSLSIALASLALVLGLSGEARAQAKYPSRSIEVVVPFAPGGGTDNMMRMITGIMEENKWSPQPVNVNNRPGGSGTIGYSYLISKKGDSHIVAGATPMSSTISLLFGLMRVSVLPEPLVTHSASP